MLAAVARYIDVHEAALQAMAGHAGVDEAILDLSVFTQEGRLTQSTFFPLEFVRRAGQIGLALAVSHYPT